MYPSAGARTAHSAAGTAHAAPPARSMASPTFGGAPPGTLASGTRVMIGQIVVTVQKYLSQGGFAHVYLVTTDKPIAMPVSATSEPGSTKAGSRGETLHVLKRMAVPDKEALSSVRSEVEVHKSLRSHPNIVHFIEASATSLPGGGYEIFILMEYCSGGGIIDLMNSRLRNRLTEAEVLKIFGDVAAGLSVMHHMDPPLMHRDLKVENILLAPPPRSNPSAGPTYKLCDFGSTAPILSRRAPKSLEEVKRLEADLNKHTTLQYRAPEMVDVYQRRIIDEKADVWAMGVLLYKLCYYTTPFEENGGGPLAILNARYRFPHMPAYSQRLKDLIASMLQEQSTSRPTIDQVIIGIHRILGTSAPASATHYATLSANGKQMQPLPSVVSSSSTKPMSGSGADVAARAMAQKQSKGDGPAMGVDRDLIEMGPSDKERRRAEEEESKRRSEGITPMRRGRPNRQTTSASTTSQPNRTASPSKTGDQLRPIVPPQPSGPSLGFADSFSPPGAPAPPSRPASGLHYSPSMPGLEAASNRASPLPTAVSPLPKASQPNDEASSRFPSVEELDRQYGTAKPYDSNASRPAATSETSPSMTSSSSRASFIPGLSERAPVSAMAGKFGNKAAATSTPATSTPAGHSPTLISPAINGRWTGGVGSAPSVAKRWTHQGAESSSAAKESSSEQLSKEMPAPALPARKPQPKDWLMAEEEEEEEREAGPQPAAVPRSPLSASRAGAEEAESSGEEDARPEDVDEPVAPAKKRQSMIGKSLFEERRDAAKDRNSSLWSKPPSVTAAAPTGKVKKPGWLQQEREAEAAKQGKEVGLAAEAYPTGERAGQHGAEAESAHGGERDRGESVAAAAPAWDEDDEEMHFLPQPDLNQKQGYSSMTGHAQAAAATQTRRYADAATSPGPGSPDVASPNETTPVQVRPTVSAPLARTAPPPVAKEQKPTSFVSPRPIRSQSIKAVGGMVSKYQDMGVRSGESSAEHSNDSVADSQRGQRRDSLGRPPKSVTSPAAPPPPVSSKPASWGRRETEENRSSLGKKAESMKPWEREALEKEQVERYGSVRRASPSKPEPEAAAAAGEEGPRGGTRGNQEAQERFSGVSSLISQWQANSSKGAPGWGTVGGGANGPPVHASGAMGRVKSKDEEERMKRSSTIGSMAARRGALPGRLASRDV